MELESLDVSGGATSDSSKNIYSASSYPDYPKKLDFPSTEDYNKAVKNFFEVKGFKHIDNFSEDEKKEIVEDCVMNLIGPKTLCQKHNTLTHVICTFVREKGYQVPPEDLSNHPDFPKKSDDVSDEDYKAILKKYWKDRRKGKRKAENELKAEYFLENMIPDDLTDHPNFPEYLDGCTDEEYAEKVKKYWINRRKSAIKKLKSIQIEIDSAPSDLSGSPNSSSKNMYSASSYTHYPKKLEFSSLENFNKAVKTFFEVKGFKHIDDFSEEEKKEIVEDCVMNLIGPKTLSQKHNTLTHVICTFVREKGYQVPPEDLSNHPDFPKKSDDVSDDDYKTILKKYWKDRRKQKKNTKT